MQKEWGAVKVVCDVCGSTHRRDSRADHIKTKKHLQSIAKS